MKEADLSLKICKMIRGRGGYAQKIHGSRFQAGSLDIDACYRGIFIGIESKLPGRGNTLTDNQRATMDAIKAADGLAIMAESVAQVEDLLERIDKRLAAR